MPEEVINLAGDITGLSEVQADLPSELPTLPLRDIVIYPFMIVPLFVSRERSIKAIDEALAANRMIVLVAQKDAEIEEPAEKDLYGVGTVSVVMRKLNLPDGRIRILVQGLLRVKIRSIIPRQGYLCAKIEPITEASISKKSVEIEALMRNIKSLMERAVTLGKEISPEVLSVISNLEDPGRLADFSASNLDLKIEDAQLILETIDPVERLRKVNELLSKEIEILMVQQDINIQARADIDRSQREYFLRQQLKAIQAELGEGMSYTKR